MAKSCCLASCQAPAQAFIRPAMWLPGIKNLHLATESWEITGCTQSTAIEAVTRGITNIEEEENLLIREERSDYLQIWSFTSHCNWLDVVELTFTNQDNNTIVQARSFSTGFIPVCCPLSFLFNCFFFWVPFSGNGFNTHRLEAIRKSVQDIQVNITDKGPDCC